MDISLGPGLFGNRTGTGALLVLALVERSHPSELGRILDTTKSNVLKALEPLEQAGIIASVLVGRTRSVSLNPRYFAAAELRALLDKMALSSPALLERVSSSRRRPRRAGKQL